MQRMHYAQPSEPEMQSNLLPDLSVNTAARLEAPDAQGKPAPIELDLTALSQVAGGLAPRGTWGADLIETTDAPRGTW